MRGGLVVGMVWGILVSAIVLAAMSLSMPLPPRPGAEAPVVEAAAPAPAEEPEVVVDITPGADPVVGTPPAAEAQSTTQTASVSDPVPLPAGSGFNQPPPETPAALPETDAPLDLAGSVATDEDAPEPAASIRPAPDATSAPQPDAALTPAQPSAPAADTSDAPAVAVTTTVEDEPAVSEPVLEEAALVDDAPVDTESAPVVASAEADRAAPEDTAPALPQVTAPTEDPVETAVVETAPSRLPQIEAPEPETEAAEGDGTADATASDGDSASADAAPVDAGPNALRDHAVAFDGAVDQALMAVVLIDDPSLGLTTDTLTRFAFPVAFAIDPLSDGAADRAAAYRAAGFEVVIWGDILAEGAAAEDVPQVLEGATQILPEAVAVLDSPDGRIQGDRPILDAVVEHLGITGHGLVAYPQGLNAAEQTARRADVPAATLFRQLDDEDQRATVITRFLARAGFAAGEGGTVVVVGRTRPDTVTALFSWALGERTSGLEIAPLSAVLLRNAEN